MHNYIVLNSCDQVLTCLLEDEFFDLAPKERIHLVSEEILFRTGAIIHGIYVLNPKLQKVTQIETTKTEWKKEGF